MAHDALGAHSRDELVSDVVSARPVQAGLTSAATFAVGAALPLITSLVAPAPYVAPVVAGTSLVFLTRSVPGRHGPAEPQCLEPVTKPPGDEALADKLKTSRSGTTDRRGFQILRCLAKTGRRRLRVHAVVRRDSRQRLRDGDRPRTSCETARSSRNRLRARSSRSDNVGRPNLRQVGSTVAPAQATDVAI